MPSLYFNRQKLAQCIMQNEIPLLRSLLGLLYEEKQYILQCQEGERRAIHQKKIQLLQKIAECRTVWVHLLADEGLICPSHDVTLSFLQHQLRALIEKNYFQMRYNRQLLCLKLKKMHIMLPKGQVQLATDNDRLI